MANATADHESYARDLSRRSRASVQRRNRCHKSPPCQLTAGDAPETFETKGRQELQALFIFVLARSILQCDLNCPTASVIAQTNPGIGTIIFILRLTDKGCTAQLPPRRQRPGYIQLEIVGRLFPGIRYPEASSKIRARGCSRWARVGGRLEALPASRSRDPELQTCDFSHGDSPCEIPCPPCEIPRARSRTGISCSCGTSRCRMALRS